MLVALCSQRDRFKGKVRELQEALAAANTRAAASEQDKAALQADNVALVERLRYVSSYSCAFTARKREPALCRTSCVLLVCWFSHASSKRLRACIRLRIHRVSD
jgi:predicted transcriptional regulator of viral defense system